MAAGPAEAFKYLNEYVSVDAPPRLARDILTQICLDQGWAQDPTSARVSAERWEKGFLKYIERELGKLNRLGRFSQFSINSSSPYMIQGAAFVEPADSAPVKNEKLARLRVSDFYSALCSLEPAQFEALCVGILSLMGVKSPVLTPYSRDEGIDFYGSLDMGQFLRPNATFPSFESQLQVWVIGQAKHFQEGQASTPDIRELVGAVHLAKSRAFGSGGEDKLAGLQIRACDPILYMFFCTGRISRDGWRLLDLAGVTGMDGEMIAALLADNRVGTAHGSFSRAGFLAWVDTFT